MHCANGILQLHSNSSAVCMDKSSGWRPGDEASKQPGVGIQKPAYSLWLAGSRAMYTNMIMVKDSLPEMPTTAK